MERERFSHLGHYLVSVNNQFHFSGKTQSAAAYVLSIVTACGRCTLLWSKRNTCQRISTEKT